MANMQRITSFKSFTELKNQEGAMKLREENNAKRAQTVTSISAALEELGITSLTELSEEQKAKFIAKLFNEDRAEDIEDEIKDLGEPEDAEDGESLEANESNVFIYAAAKAKAEGRSEFEFNGKTYKVTLKKNTGLNESIELIVEGTRGFFGKIDKSGNITAVYTHYDSYPENMLPIIKKSYKDANAVDAVIVKGDNSGLENDIEKMNFYNDKNSMKPLTGKAAGFTKFLRDASNSGAEFIYLYDERDKKWYMADTYEDKALKPAFESLQINEWAVRGMDANFDTEEDLQHVRDLAKKVGVRVTYDPDGNAPYAGSLSLSGRDKKAILKIAAITGHLEDIKDGAYEIEESVVTEGEEYVGYVEYAKGKKLMGTFKDMKAAKTWNDKNVDELLDDKSVEKVGYMSKSEWDKKEAKYAIKEAVINEEDIDSDESFAEYAKTVLQSAFKDDYDDAKAQEVIDGILGKVDGNYEEAIGMLTSSLGESAVTEKIDVSYWEGYHEGADKITSSSKVARAVEDAVEEWNDNNEDGKDNEVSSSGEKKVMNLAHDFFKAAGWISKDVIDAMIAQES